MELAPLGWVLVSLAVGFVVAVIMIQRRDRRVRHTPSIVDELKEMRERSRRVDQARKGLEVRESFKNR
jgi:hypothetical protein